MSDPNEAEGSSSLFPQHSVDEWMMMEPEEFFPIIREHRITDLDRKAMQSDLDANTATLPGATATNVARLNFLDDMTQADIELHRRINDTVGQESEE